MFLYNGKYKYLYRETEKWYRCMLVVAASSSNVVVVVVWWWSW